LTPDELITALLGDGWTEEMLPMLLNFIVRWSVDANRYYIIRDNAFNIEFTNEPNSRENIAMFNQTIDDLGQLLVNENQ